MEHTVAAQMMQTTIHGSSVYVFVSLWIFTILLITLLKNKLLVSVEETLGLYYVTDLKC